MRAALRNHLGVLVHSGSGCSRSEAVPEALQPLRMLIPLVCGRCFEPQGIRDPSHLIWSEFRRQESQVLKEVEAMRNNARWRIRAEPPKALDPQVPCSVLLYLLDRSISYLTWCPRKLPLWTTSSEQHFQCLVTGGRPQQKKTGVNVATVFALSSVPARPESGWQLVLLPKVTAPQGKLQLPARPGTLHPCPDPGSGGGSRYLLRLFPGSTSSLDVVWALLECAICSLLESACRISQSSFVKWANSGYAAWFLWEWYTTVYPMCPPWCLDEWTLHSWRNSHCFLVFTPSFLESITYLLLRMCSGVP